MCEPQLALLKIDDGVQKLEHGTAVIADPVSTISPCLCLFEPNATST